MEQITEVKRTKRCRRGKRKSKRRSELEKFHACQQTKECEGVSTGSCAICEAFVRSDPGAKKMKLLRPHCSPKAPENYTQFLMEDKYMPSPWELQLAGSFTPERRLPLEDTHVAHDDEETPITSPSSVRVPDVTDTEMDMYFYDNDNEDSAESLNFANKDFEDVFNRVHEDDLFTKNRKELVIDFLQLEQKMTYLEEKLEHTQKNQYNSNNPIKTLEEEYAMLLRENKQLKAENELLKFNAALTSNF